MSQILVDNGDGTFSGLKNAGTISLPALLAKISGSVFGNYPNTWNVQIADTAPDTGDGSIVMETSGDMSAYNHHEISVVAGTGATTVTVLVSHDGVTYEATPVMLLDRSAATGSAAQVSDIKAVGNYVLKGAFKSIKILQNGAGVSAAYQVRGSHTVR